MMLDLISFVKAMTLGKVVPEDIRDERIRICAICDKKKIDRFRKDFCSMCGCSVSSQVSNIRNLAAYEENLPKWGCKHPWRNRKRNKGWQR